ncbi:MAG TPA: response regulator [bacterium]|jgi:response regulator RpfG family c-di-GMP phosphodiesterase
MEAARVLFVDDEPNVLKALRRVFMDEDLEIATAPSGDAGLEHLRQHSVDLILSDHNMPGMSGTEFLAQAREIQPKAIRMLITGRSEIDIVLSAINKGHVYKFFYKPWDDDQLRVSVLRALEFRDTREKMRQQEAELARLSAYRQTMITVSHYINNFNCALTMSLESLMDAARSHRLPEECMTPQNFGLLKEALRAAEKVTAVLHILNRVEELKVVDYDSVLQMIDIETEVKEAVRKIEEG